MIHRLDLAVSDPFPETVREDLDIRRRELAGVCDARDRKIAEIHNRIIGLEVDNKRDRAHIADIDMVIGGFRPDPGSYTRVDG